MKSLAQRAAPLMFSHHTLANADSIDLMKEMNELCRSPVPVPHGENILLARYGIVRAGSILACLVDERGMFWHELLGPIKAI